MRKGGKGERPTDGEAASADLSRFGYEQTLKRDFSLWSVFALAFAFISPIVALYAIFGWHSRPGDRRSGGASSWSWAASSSWRWSSGVAVADRGQPLLKARYADETPVGRVGSPDEIAATVALLARKDSAAFVGQVMQPSGGTTRSGA
jgi:hypothetical protein